MSDRLDFRSGPDAERPRPVPFRQRLTTGFWLLVIWVAIRGSVTIGSIVGGILVTTVLMVLFRRGSEPSGSHHTIHPWWVLRYLAHFVFELLKANVQVALAVISPSRIEHRRAIIEVPLPHSSRLVGALLANAVSLTPGTSIIEVSNEPPSFHVHVLEMSSADEIRSSIAELHWRLVRAIGPDEARESVEADAAELRRRAAAASLAATSRRGPDHDDHADDGRTDLSGGRDGSGGRQR